MPAKAKKRKGGSGADPDKQPAKRQKADDKGKQKKPAPKTDKPKAAATTKEVKTYRMSYEEKRRLTFEDKTIFASIEAHPKHCMAQALDQVAKILASVKPPPVLFHPASTSFLAASYESPKDRDKALKRVKRTPKELRHSTYLDPFRPAYSMWGEGPHRSCGWWITKDATVTDTALAAAILFRCSKDGYDRDFWIYPVLKHGVKTTTSLVFFPTAVYWKGKNLTAFSYFEDTAQLPGHPECF